MAVNILTRLRSSEINSNIAAVKGDEEVEKMRHRARRLSDKHAELEE